MAVPVVRPWTTPERISTLSLSRRCVTWRDVPGFRRSSSFCRSRAASSNPGGQPSTTPPPAGACASPNDVTQYRRPKVLPDIWKSSHEKRPRLEHALRQRLSAGTQVALEHEVEQ